MAMEDSIPRPAAGRLDDIRQRLTNWFDMLFNRLAVIFVGLTVLAALVMAAIFANPNVLRLVPGGGDLVPATYLPKVPALGLSSGTPDGPAVYPTLPPEWTATYTPTATSTRLPPTRTALPTATEPGPAGTLTVTATLTATPQVSGPTQTATATRSSYPYALQPGYPTYLPNFSNTAGCAWLGIAGQVFGLDGRPVINLTIHLEGNGLSVDALTGSQPAYGPGGYEIPLGDRPVTTTDVYTIQLRTNTGTPLSAVIPVPTFGDCARNLVLANFVQNH
jgi:hypothetical protein